MNRADDAREWTGFEVAIIGFAGRFPGASDVGTFWRNIRGGVESIARLSDEDLERAGVPADVRTDPRYVPAAAKLEGIDRFDAAFFGITPRDADLMDPQHRLFLECTWEALESAGYDSARTSGSVGIFGGSSTNSYLTENLLTNPSVDAASLSTLFGNHSDYLTTRVSYKLNLKGPSVDVQTGCSSSLVAIHMAAQSLIAGECDLALAGGVAIVVPHGRGYLYQDQGIYSPDGHCRAFSSRAEGTVGGSGVSVVALKRLQDALDDGDSIRAVIKGSSINNDGSDKIGYAAPSEDGQAAVIKRALAMAEVSPDAVSYIEAHGTGTALGDPIEVAALTAAFRAKTDRKGFCAIGSVKTNIGHLDSAAGAAGLIKVALALEAGELPPTLNCDEPDPKIDFPNTPFRVNTELVPWQCEGPRRAGVSSFGIGGTNAHVVLEEAPQPAPAAGANRDLELLVLSARTPAALDEATANLARHLREHADDSFADVAHTLQVGRAEFDHRRTLVARDAEDAADALEALDGARVRTFRQAEQARPVVFLFPGQGAQHPGMARELYDAEPVVREWVDRASTLLEPELGLDLRELLYPSDADVDAAAEALNETRYTQPALFVIEFALAKLWIEWGVEPEAMIGHSIGEYVAATLAGVFSFENALVLVATRGRLMQDLERGSMLAIPLAPSEVEPLLTGALALAAVNEESASVVSGPSADIDALRAELERRGVASRVLRTSHAFHSSMMDPILAEFGECVRSAAPEAPAKGSIPFVSNVSGTWIQASEATDPDYWAQHLRRTVRFADGVRELLSNPSRVFLEVGPSNTLTTLSSRSARQAKIGTPEEPFVACASLRHPKEERTDHTCLFDALGRLWLARVPVRWKAIRGDESRRRVLLPTYPFQRASHWIAAGSAASAAPLVGKNPNVSDWFYFHSWKRAAIARASVPAEPDDVLVFSDDSELGRTVVRELRATGARVTVVVDGIVVDGASASDTLSLAAPDRAGYEALVRELETRGGVPGRIVHLWGATGGDSSALERGFFSPLFLAQALTESGAGDGRRLLLVTQGAQAVTGGEELVPERAAALGAARSIAQECAGLACRVIDIDPSNVPQLLRELDDGTTDPVVALRGGHRWVPSFEPVSVPAPDAQPAALREGGHFLVTGGLGSIGLEIASVLADVPRAKIVLLGRSAFPQRSERDSWVATHGADDETSKRIAMLRSIEARAGEVWLARADVCDAQALRAAISASEERFGPLNGVVHAAGGAKEMAPFSETTRADCDVHLQPKLRGLLALEEALGDRSLDFCLVQSSLAVNLGALGMVGYVAAHAFVDAFVAAHNARADELDTSRWTSANWDNWLSWKEPEMELAPGQTAYFMSPAEGAQALGRVLDLPAGTQVVVSTGDLAVRSAEWLEPSSAQARSASQELHERPELGSRYAEPSSPAESALVQAWGEVLGIADVGVDDSFFELGGDSVLGLQVVAKLSRAGFRIRPAQIFEHPTIRALAAVVTVTEGAQPSSAEQGSVQGAAPLVPIQRWFFEQGYPDPAHFNLPMLFEVPSAHANDRIRRALTIVVEHHDALRLRFVQTDGELVQSHAELGASVESIEVEEVDLTGVAEAEREATMTARANELHRGFDLERGPLVRAAVFRSGDREPARVLWIVHHLLVDVVSWRVLGEDFRSALEQLAAGGRVALPPKTTSFKAWAIGLAEHAGSEATAGELAHWTRVANAVVDAVPVDSTSGANDFGSSRTLVASLDESNTRALLSRVPEAYETRIDEVLLTALALGARAWNGLGSLRIDLEGHGREDILEGVDLSRTVGWFTTLYPAHLELAGVGDPGEALKTIKESLRTIPRRGIGFGLLRYLRPDAESEATLAAMPTPEISLLYLGQFDGSRTDSGMRLLQSVSGKPCSAAAPRGHLFEFLAFVDGGSLRVELSYSSNRHEEQTARAFLERFMDSLGELIEHCSSADAGGHTPSDFPAARVNQASLDKLLSKIGKKKGAKK